jgi:hypothetical protein
LSVKNRYFAFLEEKERETEGDRDRESEREREVGREGGGIERREGG